MNKKVGLQLYTLREHLKTESDIAQTLKKVKAAGYDIVQISGCGVSDVKVLSKLIKDAGLISNSVHEKYDRITKETDAFIEDCRVMGYTTAAIPYLPEEMRTIEGYKKVAREANAAGEKLFKAGVILTYHNHDFEFENLGGIRGIDIIYGETNPKYLQSELDVYWVQSGGADPAAWILKMKDRAPIVHLKEMGIKGKERLMLPVGEGNMNWQSILKALEEVKTGFYYVEQDRCNGEDPFACIKKSLDNLKKMGVE